MGHFDAGDPQRAAGDLGQDGDQALPDFYRGGFDHRTIRSEANPCLGVVIGSLGEAEVLETEGISHPSPNVMWLGGETRAPRKLTVMRRRCRLRKRHRLQTPYHIDRGKRGLDDLPGGRHGVAGAEGIQLAQIERVHSEGRGEPVHLCFVGKADLYRSKSPHRPTRRVVGAGSHPVDRDRVAPIWPDCEIAGVGQNGGCGRGVGPAIDHHPRFDPDQTSVLIGLVAVAEPRRMAVDMPGERLRAVIDHLDRPPGVEGQHAEMDVQVDVFSGPEGATDPRRVGTHLIRSESEAGHHLLLIDVHVLARRVQIDTALAVRDGETGLGPQRRLILHPDLVLTLDHDGAAQALVPASDAQPAKHLVTVVGLFGVGQSVELFVANLDRSRRPPGGVVVLGGHHGHRLSPELDLVAGQNRLVGVLQSKRGPPRDIVCRETRVHTADCQRRGQVDRDDACPGVGATDRGRPEHPLGSQVLGVFELATELGHAIGTERGIPDHTTRHPDAATRPSAHRSSPLPPGRG